MELLAAYLPADRRHALAQGRDLPDRTQGTALFADISDFTPLTGSLLNALGPLRGAEELSRHLNAVYDAVIAEVDRYGGSVLAFSGDAITCWFDGDTGRRATTCGLAMQAAMRGFAALTLSTGMQVALAMKVALATGPARRLVVGDPAIQRLDVLAGATLDRMAAAEHHAERGEVVAEASTLAQLGAEVEVAREAEDDEGRFAALSRLKRRAPQRPWPKMGDDQLTAESLRPWLLPPVFARLREGQARFLAEIRPSVALFMSFGGIDYDADSQSAQKLDAYLCAVQQALRPYDAFVLQLTLGDKGCYLCAAFGAPLAHDDDPLRAVAAARTLHTLTGHFDYIRDVRIGLNEGRVWCGAYGGRTRHTYGVLGDAVNVAARLMQHAPPGETLISPSLAQSVETHYALEAVGPLKLKGKAEPLPAYRVVCPWASPVFIVQAAARRLVGRQAELAWLNALWQAARGGGGCVARLTGAGGVGKSRLVQELAINTAQEGALVAVGLCHSAEQLSVYKPWRAIVLRLLEVSEDGQPPDRLAAAVQAALCAINPTWQMRAPLLGDVLNLPLPDNPTTAAFDPQLRREALWSLVVDVLDAAASRQPVLLWLDNVHSMDEASCALTLAVSRALVRYPVLLLCTQRPFLRDEADPFAEWTRGANYQALTLPTLTDDEVAALVQAQLGGSVRPLALALLQKQAQGNAFYAGELVAAMRDAGHLNRRADGQWNLSERLFGLLQDQHCLRRRSEDSPWSLAPEAVFSAEALGLPDSVQRAITARLDQLAPEAQLTLKTASVIGPLFELRVLSAAHPRFPGQAALEAQLLEMRQRGLVRPAAEQAQPLAYAFEHNLIQEGVYDSLLSEQQTALHALVGAALEQARPEAVEQLAHHFSRAGNPDKAPLYLGLAADKARRSYANETALKYYEQALGLEARWEWRKAQVEVMGILGQRTEQKAALETLETMRGVPAFEVAYLWGQYYEAISDYGRAEETLERARNIARERFNRAHEAASLTQLGLVDYRCGRYPQAQQWFEQAQTLFPPRASYSAEDARLLAKAANGVGLVQFQLGNFDRAGPCFQRALELYRPAGDKRGEAEALSNLGSAAFQQGRFREALGFHQQALELRRTIGDRARQGSSLVNLAQAARDSGDFAQAEAWLQSALRIQRETGNRWDEVNTWIDLGIMHQELGNFREAQDCLRQGLELSREIGDEAGEAYVLLNSGLVALDQEAWGEAIAFLQTGLELARNQKDKPLEAMFASYCGALSMATYDLAKAEQWSTLALTIRREAGLVRRSVDDLANLALAAAATGDLAKAKGYAHATLAELRACHGEGPEFPQRAYWACYSVLESGGEQAEALAALQAAYDWVMARAVRITTPELRHSFLENAPRNRQVLDDARRVLGVKA